MNSENKQKVLYIVTGIVLFIAIFFIAVQYENKYVVNYSEIFVDLATAGIALTAVLVTIYTFNINRKHLQKQQFESTFFNMMKQLEDIVSKLSVGSVKGRDIFEYFYENHNVFIYDKITMQTLSEFNKSFPFLFKSIITKVEFLNEKDNNDYVTAKGVENIINGLGVFGYENISEIYKLDHYFRYLYRIIRFIDEAKFLDNNTGFIDERYKYIGILRATLSPYELVFLFYNGLSEYGNEKVKPLIEKYSILKNIRSDLTANSTLDVNLDDFTDNCKNDYYRYNDNVKDLDDRYYYSAFHKDITLFQNEERKKVDRKELVKEICNLHDLISNDIEKNFPEYSKKLKDKIVELNNEFRPEYLSDNKVYHIIQKMDKNNYESKMNSFIYSIIEEND